MNPAKELLEIFQYWEKQNGAAYTQMKLESPEGMARAIRAVTLVKDIQELLSLLEKSGKKVDMYQAPLTTWQKAIFHYPNAWQDHAFNKGDEPMLRALELYFEDQLLVVKQSIQELQANSEEIIEQLDNLVQIFLSDPDIDTSFSSHASWLIEHIKTALLSGDEISIQDFNESIRLLRIYVEAAAERSSDDTNIKKFREFLVKYFNMPATQLMLSGAIGYGVNQLPSIPTAT